MKRIHITIFILAGSLAVADEPWTGKRIHPFKDAATEAMVRAIANEKDPVVRQEAAQAFAAIANSRLPMAERLEVTGDVAAKLRDADPAVQETAIRAAQREHVPAIVACLTSDDAGVRIAATTALGNLAGKEASAALTGRLADDPDPLVRRAAATALAQLGCRPELVSFLKDRRASRRREAARALAAFAEPPLAETLHPLLNDSDAGVVRATVMTLGALRNPASVPLLLERLKAGDDAAAAALGQIGDARALPGLRRVLMEMAAYEPVTRQSALNALSMMEHREVLDQALEIATRPVIPQPQSSEKLYDDDAVRIAAVRCISALGDANVAAKLLAGFTQTPPVSMRPAVAEAVTRLTGRPHRPVPEESFRPWSVESRKPPVFGPLPLAGVQEVNQTH